MKENEQEYRDFTEDDFDKPLREGDEFFSGFQQSWLPSNHVGGLPSREVRYRRPIDKPAEVDDICSACDGLGHVSKRSEASPNVTIPKSCPDCDGLGEKEGVQTEAMSAVDAAFALIAHSLAGASSRGKVNGIVRKHSKKKYSKDGENLKDCALRILRERIEELKIERDKWKTSFEMKEEGASEAAPPSKEKIVQVSGFSVKNQPRLQTDFMVVGVTDSGRVVISNGDREWTDISPANQPEHQPE